MRLCLFPCAVASAATKGSFVINYVLTVGGTAGAQLSITTTTDACTIYLSAYASITGAITISASSGVSVPTTGVLNGGADVGAGYRLSLSSGCAATNMQLRTSTANQNF